MRVGGALGLWLVIGVMACASRSAVVLDAPVEPEPEPAAASEPKPAKEHPQTAARELYRLAEARFAEDDAGGGVGLLEASLAAMPDDVDPVLRHQLEARLTHMQLTAWQADADLSFVLAARQRLFTRMTAFPKTAASLTPNQADVMRDELFEQLSDVEAQLELHLDETEASQEELAVLAAVADARAPDTPTASAEAAGATSRSRRRRAADGSEVREIDVKTGRQSAFDDPAAQARFNGRFATPGLLLTRGADMVHGPRGLVRVLDATDAQGQGARKRARRFIAPHRDALLKCYAAAFAREPVFGLQVDLSLVTSNRDTDSVEVTAGRLIDGEGDRCMTEVFAMASGTRSRSGEQPASLSLLFFIQDAVLISGATGESFSPGQTPTRDAEPDPVEVHKFAPMGG